MEQWLPWRWGKGFEWSCLSLCPPESCIIIKTLAAFSSNSVDWYKPAFMALTKMFWLKCYNKKSHVFCWCSLPVMELLKGTDWMSQLNIPSAVSSCFWLEEDHFSETKLTFFRYFVFANRKFGQFQWVRKVIPWFLWLFLDCFFSPFFISFR